MIGYNLPNREIAAKLYISIKTVENYKERIKEKLEIRNIKELYEIFNLQKGI